MDDTVATILYGCKLGKELEPNLTNWANQPAVLLSKTEEILAVFNCVKERLMRHQQQQVVQEWLSSNIATTTQAIELFHAAEMSAAFTVHGLPESDQMGGGESSMRLQPQVVGQAMGASHDSNRASAAASSSQRQRGRCRTRNTDRRRERVAAPRMGNLEVPPEDGYTWRKYGQKEILGYRFPRAYYRCTHEKLYHCPAKKQVQRLDHDPYVFEVTYRSQHTCHISATAHQTPPPPLPLPLPPPTSAPFCGNWLSMDIKLQGEAATSTATPFHIQRDFRNGTGGSLASICNLVTSSGGRYGREVDHYQPVVDMADAMFNSGSSSNTSMDLIFSSIHDKWDTAEKKE